MFARARSFLCTITKLKQSPVRPALLAAAMEGQRSMVNAPDDPSTKVKHDPERHEFYIEFPTSRAYLIYEKEGNLFKIMHTEVPKEMGGLGLGKILAKAALKHIEHHKYRAKTYCEFVQYYIEKYEPGYLKYFEK